MHRHKATAPLGLIGNQTLHTAVIVSVLVAAILVIFSAWPASSAERITNQENCGAAVTKAEDAIVRANIDSGAFRVLNDHLVDMHALCAQEDFPGAETKLLDVMNALKDLEKNSKV
jgi:hypothetical protein